MLPLPLPLLLLELAAEAAIGEEGGDGGESPAVARARGACKHARQKSNHAWTLMSTGAAFVHEADATLTHHTEERAGDEMPTDAKL